MASRRYRRRMCARPSTVARCARFSPIGVADASTCGDDVAPGPGAGEGLSRLSRQPADGDLSASLRPNCPTGKLPGARAMPISIPQAKNISFRRLPDTALVIPAGRGCGCIARGVYWIVHIRIFLKWHEYCFKPMRCRGLLPLVP